MSSHSSAVERVSWLAPKMSVIVAGTSSKSSPEESSPGAPDAFFSAERMKASVMSRGAAPGTRLSRCLRNLSRTKLLKLRLSCSNLRKVVRTGLGNSCSQGSTSTRLPAPTVRPNSSLWLSSSRNSASSWLYRQPKHTALMTLATATMTGCVGSRKAPPAQRRTSTATNSRASASAWPSRRPRLRGWRVEKARIVL
uniref:Uncharacterized protein n=1 Tax=Mus musculus TaxID=10090 RepID=Q8C685_MOUSE|nr:unnamed protein product [Mus musculus]